MDRVILGDKTETNGDNMNSTIDISSAGKVLAGSESPSISPRITRSEESFTAAQKFARTRLWHWRVSDILEGVAGVLVLLYLLGVIGLAFLVLFYTFSR